MATLQFLRELLGDEFALAIPVVGCLDLLVANLQLTSLCATVEHSLFTNCVQSLAVIYVTVAMEYLQEHEVSHGCLNCLMFKGSRKGNNVNK